MQIDKNIPIPPAGHSGKRSFYPFRELEIGDSFLVPYNSEKPYATQTRLTTRAAYHERYGFKYTTRRTPEGVRVWRVA